MKLPITVQIEPYRLCAGHVGEDIFRPVVMSRHRSKAAARRALIRLIKGTDTRAREYLKSVDGRPYAIALRYLAVIAEGPHGPPYRKYAANDLRA